ncbi:MAG: hypothetical protein ACYCT7_00090 [bacterium]
MNIDKKIINDIKNIYLWVFGLFLKLWKNKLKIVKWLVIILVMFLAYRVYKILTIHHPIIKNHVVTKIIHIEKSGYYRLAVYIKPKTVYFHKRQILAKTKGLQALSQLTVHHYLYAYKFKILLNKKNIDKFKKDRYRHLIYRDKITGKGSSPFVLFYVSFSNPDLADRIIYTSVNIPIKNVLRNYTVLGKFRNNGYIKLTKNPNKKKPKVSLTKFLYLYPQFTIKGKVKYVKAYIKYKIKHKKYFSKRFNLLSGGLINLYGILKNKKIRYWRNANIIKIYFVVKKYKHIKGSVKFTNLGLIYPNYEPLEKTFEDFVYRRYFTRFTKKSGLFNKILLKTIRQAKKNGALELKSFNFVSTKKIKKALIHKVLNEIFLIDYNTKIKHIGNIKNKIVRHFYRFIYKKYLTKQNFFSHLLSYFNKPRHFYKNILIPIGSKAIRIKTRKEFDGNFYNKTAYIYVHFNKLKLYKYWPVHKHILRKILKKYNYSETDSADSTKSFIIRGNNDDYWHGKHYYRYYPILKGLKIFAFDKKINEISGYFYYRNLPIKYPKFLSFSKNLHHNNHNNKGKINFLNLVSNKFTYKNQLKLINSFNSNPTLFLKRPFFTSITLKKENIINTVNKNKRFERIGSGHVNGLFYPVMSKTGFNTRWFALKFKNTNFINFHYGLIKFHINGAYNEKLAKNFKKLQCLLVNFNKIKKIKVPIKYYLLNDSLFFVLNLKKINLKKVDNIIISFESKQLAIPYSYNFKISKNIYLVRYTKSHMSSLNNIIKNDPLYQLNNKKIFLKDYMLSLKQFNDIFKNDGSFISQKIYLKKGNYYIKKVLNEIFKIKIASVKKINKYAKLQKIQLIKTKGKIKIKSKL